MKSTRITKHNKLRKNSKLEKRVIKGGTKKGNKKHVKRSIEKKSRKMRGGSYTNGGVKPGRVKALIKHFQRGPHHNNGSVLLNSEGNPYGGKFNKNRNRNRNRKPSSGYDVLTRPIRPGANETYNTPSNLQLLKRIVDQIDIDKQTKDDKEKIEDALARANSLSANELENLKAELEQLIGNQQPLYEEVNGPNEATGELYEQVEPQLASPRKPPPELPPPRIKCELRKARDCVQPCKLVTTDSKRFGFLPIKIKKCVEKSALDPRKKPITSGQNTSDPDYEEANNRSRFSNSNK